MCARAPAPTFWTRGPVLPARSRSAGPRPRRPPEIDRPGSVARYDEGERSRVGHRYSISASSGLEPARRTIANSDVRSSDGRVLRPRLAQLQREARRSGAPSPRAPAAPRHPMGRPVASCELTSLSPRSSRLESSTMSPARISLRFRSFPLPPAHPPLAGRERSSVSRARIRSLASKAAVSRAPVPAGRDHRRRPTVVHQRRAARSASRRRAGEDPKLASALRISAAAPSSSPNLRSHATPARVEPPWASRDGGGPRARVLSRTAICAVPGPARPGARPRPEREARGHRVPHSSPVAASRYACRGLRVPLRTATKPRAAAVSACPRRSPAASSLHFPATRMRSAAG